MEVQVQFSPYLTEESIQEEAMLLAIRRTVEANKARQEEEYHAKGQRTSGRRKSLAAPSGGVSSGVSTNPSLVSSRSDHSDLQIKGMNQPEHG